MASDIWLHLLGTPAVSANSDPVVVLEACTGLCVAPAAWAVNTQLGQILPYLDCQSGYSAIASFAGVFAACAAGAVSWRAANRAAVSESPAPAVSFLGSTGALSALIFSFALFMQGAASLVVSGCER